MFTHYSWRCCSMWGWCHPPHLPSTQRYSMFVTNRFKAVRVRHRTGVVHWLTETMADTFGPSRQSDSAHHESYRQIINSKAAHTGVVGFLWIRGQLWNGWSVPANPISLVFVKLSVLLWWTFPRVPSLALFSPTAWLAPFEALPRICIFHRPPAGRARVLQRQIFSRVSHPVSQKHIETHGSSRFYTYPYLQMLICPHEALSGQSTSGFFTQNSVT